MRKSSFSPETLSHLLLWTPWDARINSEIPPNIRDALLQKKSSFYQKCFVPLSSANDEVDMWERLNSLLDNISRKTIIITSFAGVGKSTLLHAILEQKNLYDTSIILDAIEEVDLYPDGGWNEWLDIYCCQKPLFKKIIKLTIVKIYDLLLLPTSVVKESRISKMEVFNKLKHLNENMHVHFKALINKDKSIWEIINKYLSNKIDYYDENNQSLVLDSYTHQVAFILYSIYGKKKKKPFTVLKELLELLSILAICNMNNPKKDSICIAFDNIEHYIDNAIIHDEEVFDLLFMLNGTDGEGFITKQNSIYRNRFSSLTEKFDKSMIYSERIRLVLAVREFSANMLPSMADRISRLDDCIIKLNKQISLLEVIKKRIDFIKHAINTYFYNYEPIFTIINILDDELMIDRISCMFSYNKRKSVRNLIDAFYREGSQGITYIRSDLIKGYNNLCNDSNYSSAIKKRLSHGRHQLIHRALYDSMLDNLRMSSTRLGDALKLDYFGAERGSVRQLLVYLARRSFNNEPNTPIRYQPMAKLSDLIRDIYIKPNLINNKNALRQFPKIEHKKISNLAKTLNILRSRDKLERLSPLILLRFDKNGLISDYDIEEILIKICENPSIEIDSNGLLRYGVQCTIAGRMFVNYCASFEFVVARHYNTILERTKVNPSCIPLFAININKISDLKNIIIYINAVKDLTINDCIVKMVEQIMHFLNVNNAIQYNHLYKGLLVYKGYNFTNNKHQDFELTHAQRLIMHHIRYIDDFRLYAVEKLCNNPRNSVNSQEIIDFSQKLLDIIGQYINKYKELTEEYIYGEEHFFIGGPKRSWDDDWGSKPFGYKKYLYGFEAARAEPLSIISVAPDNDVID